MNARTKADQPKALEPTSGAKPDAKSDAKDDLKSLPMAEVREGLRAQADHER